MPSTMDLEIHTLLSRYTLLAAQAITTNTSKTTRDSCCFVTTDRPKSGKFSLGKSIFFFFFFSLLWYPVQISHTERYRNTVCGLCFSTYRFTRHSEPVASADSPATFPASCPLLPAVRRVLRPCRWSANFRSRELDFVLVVPDQCSRHLSS